VTAALLWLGLAAPPAQAGGPALVVKLLDTRGGTLGVLCGDQRRGVRLRDDGVAPDPVPNDGVWSGVTAGCAAPMTLTLTREERTWSGAFEPLSGSQQELLVRTDPSGALLVADLGELSAGSPDLAVNPYSPRPATAAPWWRLMLSGGVLFAAACCGSRVGRRRRAPMAAGEPAEVRPMAELASLEGYELEGYAVVRLSEVGVGAVDARDVLAAALPRPQVAVVMDGDLEAPGGLRGRAALEWLRARLRKRDLVLVQEGARTG
jgi:hypothetical protein